MEKALNSILTGQIVEWSDPEKHVAKSGKIKDVLKGIPGAGFWRLWKCNKDALRAAGVTVYAERVKAVTGEYRTHKGKSKAVSRKAWEVTVWYNKRNISILQAAGFMPCVDPF